MNASIPSVTRRKADCPGCCASAGAKTLSRYVSSPAAIAASAGSSGRGLSSAQAASANATTMMKQRLTVFFMRPRGVRPSAPTHRPGGMRSDYCDAAAAACLFLQWLELVDAAVRHQAEEQMPVPDDIGAD